MKLTLDLHPKYWVQLRRELESLPARGQSMLIDMLYESIDDMTCSLPTGNLLHDTLILKSCSMCMCIACTSPSDNPATPILIAYISCPRSRNAQAQESVSFEHLRLIENPTVCATC